MGKGAMKPAARGAALRPAAPLAPPAGPRSEDHTMMDSTSPAFLAFSFWAYFGAEPLYVPVPEDDPRSYCSLLADHDKVVFVLFSDWKPAQAYRETLAAEGERVFVLALPPEEVMDTLDEYHRQGNLAEVIFNPTLLPDNNLQVKDISFSAEEYATCRISKPGPPTPEVLRQLETTHEHQDPAGN